MKFIYVDESGDFGFSKRSTKSLIIAASFAKDAKKLSIWLKRLKRRKLIRKKAKISELKASQQSERFLRYFYNHAASDLDFRVYGVLIDKSKVPKQLVGSEGIIYFKAVEKLLDVSSSEFDKKMIWYFDRRSLKKLDWQLVQAAVRSKIILDLKVSRPHIEIHPVDSQRIVNIQFADAIAYALFRKYEFADSRWFKLIKSHIVKITTLKL